MRKELMEMLARIKREIDEEAQHWAQDEREAFYCALNEWSYQRYEEALIDSNVEMLDFED